jgi:hypothetical protein
MDPQNPASPPPAGANATPPAGTTSPAPPAPPAAGAVPHPVPSPETTSQVPAEPNTTLSGTSGGVGQGGPPGGPSAHVAGELVPAPAIPADAPTLAEAIGQLWREQVDIMAGRIFMDTQVLFGVGAIPPDVVTLKIIILNMAEALERGDRASFLYTFGRNGREVSAQINDQTIPYLPGLQIGGHIEGVLRDTINDGFKADPALRRQAQDLLDEWCSPAYPALLGEPRALMKPLAPGR